MELQSARVSIRQWDRRDDDLADEWPPYNDPLDPLWNLPRPYTGRDHWYSSFDAPSTRRTWAVDDRAGRLVGRISLREIDTRHGRARLGITFGAPYVGRGLGSEALAIFLDYYFDELGFQTMVLDVAAPNQRAVRCYEHLGFRYVGGDWRSTGACFNSRILNSPHYAPMRHFFRTNQRTAGLEVQFFEMELLKRDWYSRRRPTGTTA